MKLKYRFTLFVFTLVCGVLIVLLPSCNRSSNTGDVTEAYTPAIDSSNAYQLLLVWLNGNPVIDSNWIEWKPNEQDAQTLTATSEFANLIINDQGLCRTLIDTSFNFELEGEPYTIQMLNSYGMVNDSQIVDCHPCSPVLGAAIFKVTQNNHLLPVKLKPFITANGNFGLPGEVELIKYSKDKYALLVSADYTGQGYTTINSSLYDVNTFKEIFSFERHNDNSGAALSPEMEYSNNSDITFEESEGELHLILTRTGTKLKDKTGKIVSADYRRDYLYDAERNEFLLVRK